jgi:hypothetical protein
MNQDSEAETPPKPAKNPFIPIAERNFRISESLLAARAALPGNYFWQPFQLI